MFSAKCSQEYDPGHLKKIAFSLYKLQIHLEMCEWILEQIVKDDDFHLNEFFSDEANFYVNGEIKKQNLLY